MISMGVVLNKRFTVLCLGFQHNNDSWCVKKYS